MQDIALHFIKDVKLLKIQSKEANRHKKAGKSRFYLSENKTDNSCFSMR